MPRKKQKIVANKSKLPMEKSSTNNQQKGLRDFFSSSAAKKPRTSDDEPMTDQVPTSPTNCSATSQVDPNLSAAPADLDSAAPVADLDSDSSAIPIALDSSAALADLDSHPSDIPVELDSSAVSADRDESALIDLDLLTDPANIDHAAASVTQPSISAVDIGSVDFNNRHIIDDPTKYKISTSCWKPDDDYIIPADPSNRNFNRDWFKEYPWLAYSHEKNGAYCRSCLLFLSSSIVLRNDTRLLIKEPFRTWRVSNLLDIKTVFVKTFAVQFF